MTTLGSHSLIHSHIQQMDTEWGQKGAQVGITQEGRQSGGTSGLGAGAPSPCWPYLFRVKYNTLRTPSGSDMLCIYGPRTIFKFP